MLQVIATMLTRPEIFYASELSPDVRYESLLSCRERRSVVGLVNKLLLRRPTGVVASSIGTASRRHGSDQRTMLGTELDVVALGDLKLQAQPVCLRLRVVDATLHSCWRDGVKIVLAKQSALPVLLAQHAEGNVPVIQFAHPQYDGCRLVV